ncbi:hypothetical protein CFC21_098078 [Triticum aestivum]|uniref:Uncharacterized protein n=3 Tax=Triticum TaxID=4564 RepID=A0A9R1BP39_TRITD|nr:hypothetical protein CFC21_098078 [Triticum aestivum]VAI75935.1 unnamed protein product [Triticum turgidum subsp. durum]
MGKEALDYVLVPLGLVLMLGYHAWLLLRIQRRPATTVIGVNAINRRIWVRHIMEVRPPLTMHPPISCDRSIIAFTLYSQNHCFSGVFFYRFTFEISVFIYSTDQDRSAHAGAVREARGAGGADDPEQYHGVDAAGVHGHHTQLAHRRAHVPRRRGEPGAGGGGLLPDAPLVVGATGEAALSAKFFAILVCFLVAFLLNVQSIRYYSHTSTLVNVPIRAHRLRRPGHAVDYVTGTLNRGSYFWSLGVRAFYFSCPVFLWLFGPIPMFAACVVMVCVLYFLDVCEDWEEEQGLSGGDETSERGKDVGDTQV